MSFLGRVVRDAIKARSALSVARLQGPVAPAGQLPGPGGAPPFQGNAVAESALTPSQSDPMSVSDVDSVGDEHQTLGVEAVVPSTDVEQSSAPIPLGDTDPAESVTDEPDIRGRVEAVVADGVGAGELVSRPEPEVVGNPIDPVPAVAAEPGVTTPERRTAQPDTPQFAESAASSEQMPLPHRDASKREASIDPEPGHAVQIPTAAAVSVSQAQEASIDPEHPHSSDDELAVTPSGWTETQPSLPESPVTTEAHEQPNHPPAGLAPPPAKVHQASPETQPQAPQVRIGTVEVVVLSDESPSRQRKTKAAGPRGVDPSRRYMRRL